MKFFSKCKDGGSESTVWGYFLCEIKSLFSLAILRFDNGSRDAYHSHAFNCISWVLKGKLVEDRLETDTGYLDTYTHTPSFKPVLTFRDTTHKVVSEGTTWVVTFRGPWANKWKEIVGGEEIGLTHGRQRTY
jgi:hypothetical protein